MDKIDPTQVIQQRLVSLLEFDKYAYIINTVSQTDITNDAEFQRVFNGFYMVRRNAQWRQFYYQLFEQTKTTANPEFSTILKALYENTGNVEASFASKMLASINPSMPIWDKYVIQNLGIKLPTANDPLRIEKTISIYESICKWYEEFLLTENAKECIAKFDDVLPDYRWLSDVKKIDFYLWSIR